MWQDFNYGVEFMLLVCFLKTASREATEDALASLDKLPMQRFYCAGNMWLLFGSSG